MGSITFNQLILLMMLTNNDTFTALHLITVQKGVLPTLYAGRNGQLEMVIPVGQITLLLRLPCERNHAFGVGGKDLEGSKRISKASSFCVANF